MRDNQVVRENILNTVEDLAFLNNERSPDKSEYYQIILATDVNELQFHLEQRKIENQGITHGTVFEDVKNAFNDTVYKALLRWGELEREQDDNYTTDFGSLAISQAHELEIRIKNEYRLLPVSKAVLKLWLLIAQACENSFEHSSLFGALNIYSMIIPTKMSPHYEIYRPFLSQQEGLKFLAAPFINNSRIADTAANSISMYGSLLGKHWTRSDIWSGCFLPYVGLSEALIEQNIDLHDKSVVNANNVANFAEEYVAGHLKKRADFSEVYDDMLTIAENAYFKLPSEWWGSFIKVEDDLCYVDC